jgi:MOSC domain-containing protein YiiM
MKRELPSGMGIHCEEMVSDMIKRHYLNKVYLGKVAQRYGIETAIDKQSIETALYLSFKGLTGDECADQRHHGGFDRALHQYPIEHYRYWQDKYNKSIEWLPSGMGENLSSEGMTENNVYLGDQYIWGGAIIEVSQPRSPCFKLNQRWGVETISVDMQATSYCGWLYRVIQPGMVSVNEPLKLIERASNAMTVREVCEIFFGDPLNTDKLTKLNQQKALSESWKEKITQRLSNNSVENWRFRLLGYG